MFKNLILKKYPDYDLERYRFKFGDIIQYAESYFFVLDDYITEVKCIALTRGLNHKIGQKLFIEYSKLPYYKKGEFKNLTLKVSYLWKVGKLVHTEIGPCLLYKELDNNHFYGICINPNSWYYQQGVYL